MGKVDTVAVEGDVIGDDDCVVVDVVVGVI
jgi:hypothetical protein